MSNRGGYRGGRGWGKGHGNGKGMGRGRGEGRGMGRRGGFVPAEGFSLRQASQSASRVRDALKTRAQALMNRLRGIDAEYPRMPETRPYRFTPKEERTRSRPLDAENRSAAPVAIIDKERCVCCGLCVDVCTQNAISLNGDVTIDLNKCIGCGSCVNECPNQAISLSAKT